MSLFRLCYTFVREPLSVGQVFLSRTLVSHGFAILKTKPAKVEIPKHPPNSFMLFVNANRSLTQSEYPDKKPKEIMSLLSDKWRKMSEDEKAPYKNAYASRMKEYNAPLAKIPKKPPGVFGLFLKEKYSEVESNNPGVKTPEIMSAISDEWNGLSDSEKEQWQEKREILMQQYKEKVMNFGHGMSAEERAFIEKKRGALVHKIEKEKKMLLGYPKRPLSAFILFSQKNAEAEGVANLPVAERAKIMGRKWRELSSVEKEVYFEESRKAREKFQKDVAEWKENNPEDA